MNEKCFILLLNRPVLNRENTRVLFWRFIIKIKSQEAEHIEKLKNF